MIIFFLFSLVVSILPPPGQQYAATPPPVWIDGKLPMSKYKLVPDNPQTTDLGCNSVFSDLVGASWMAGFNGWPVRSLGAIVQSTHWVSFRCVDVRFDKHLSVRYRKDPDVQGLFVIKCVEGSFPYLYTTVPEYKVKARCVKIAKATWKIDKIYHHTMNPPRLQMEENFFDDGTMSLFSRTEGRMIAVIEWPKQRRLNNRQFTFPIPDISGRPSTSKGKGSTICDDQEYMMQKHESSSSGSVVGLINSPEEFDLTEVDPK